MDDVTALFTRAAKLWRAAADEATSQFGVRIGQNLVLEALAQADGLTPGELAERLRVATPTVVKSAQRMEAAGLLTRARDPRDRRLVRLHLSAHARSVQSGLRTARADLEQRATATLTGTERRHLASALRKIIAQLESDPEH
jgi:DNA-binding MarR family transcriptional regulator